MEWLLIFGLIAGLAGLLGRLRTAERRIAEVEEAQAHLFEELRSAMLRGASEAAPAPMPAEAIPERSAPAVRIRASVPKVAATRPSEEERMVSPPLEGPASEIPLAAEEPESGRAPFRLDLEDVFGRRLPIWAGGVTLAVAGVFLVRYSIERGLITPLLRVIMAFVFGFGLLAGAEAAHRARARVADPRVGQALAGAGLATLYAGFYLAGTQYGLIGQALAFLGLAAVTAGAIALSFRFGLPSAVLGLVGGFAAPALVGGSEANLPLLALYLGLVTAGLVLSGRRQQRPWMGMSALIGGLGWGAVLLLAGDFGPAEAVALGLYLVVLGSVLPALTHAREFEGPLRIGAALAASLQLALLVDEGGYTPLVWALYLLLGATLGFFGWRRPDIRESNAVAAALALILLAQWDGAPALSFALVAAGIAAVFSLTPLALIWRAQDRDIDGWQLAGTAAALAAIAYARFGDFASDRVEALLALSAALLAAIPALAVYFLWRRGDVRLLALHCATGAALVFAALLMVTAGWAAPLAGAAVFAALFVLLKDRGEVPLKAVLWGAALLVAGALAAHLRFGHEVEHLFGWSQDSRGAIGLVRWLALAAVLAALAWRERMVEMRRFAEAAAVLAAYSALAQVLPRDVLAWTAASLAVGLRFGLRDRPVAALAALAIAAAWALEPLGWWLGAGLASLTGDPIFASDLPTIAELVLRILPVLAALAFVRPPFPREIAGRIPPAAPMMGIALVAAHVLFKQLIAIDSEARFIAFGLIERTIWEAVLLGGAWLAMRGPARFGAQREVGIALAGAALAHFALYTGLLHNPLWTRQALGPLPLANLGLVSCGVAIAAALSLRWSAPRLMPVIDGAVMALACLAVLTLLRQAFAGSLPVLVPMSQSEDLLRSLAGIVLALAFLWLGSRRGERSWRLGSLVIMLVAVAKVFLVDAAGLDGLLRVASFMALGFSLIGIGWVYTRQLRARPAA